MTGDADTGGLLPELPPKPELNLVIPTTDHLLQIREEAKQAGKLPDLRRLVAAWQAAAEKCSMVFEELTRLAIYRLEVERDLGRHLAQTVHRGGDRAKRPRGGLHRDGCLPDDITDKQSRLYQSLAAVPEEVFRAYLDAAHAKHAVPSSAGARAFAAPANRPVGRGKQGQRPKLVTPSSSDLPPEVVECVERIMLPDVVMGDVAMPAKQRVAAKSKDALKRLHGDVFVAECPDPDRLLDAVEKARCSARLRRAVVVLPATTGAEWFRRLEHGEWLLCFLHDVRDEAGNGVVLAHFGEKPSVFRLAFRSLGVVLRAATAE